MAILRYKKKKLRYKKKKPNQKIISKLSITGNTCCGTYDPEIANQAFFVHKSAGGFGDRLLCAFFAQILRNNNINANTYAKFPYNIVCPSLPIDINTKCKNYVFTYDYKSKINVIQQNVEKFNNRFGILASNIRNSILVEYTDMPNITGTDVVIQSTCGGFSKIKEWPFFDELKEQYDKRGIRYIDVKDILKKYGRRKKGSYACLNYVYKSNICIALESGFSHIISTVGADKTIIILSGFSIYKMWSTYAYEIISSPVSCSPCFLSTRNGQSCAYDHKCMRNISVKEVLEKSIRKLDKSKTTYDYPHG